MTRDLHSVPRVMVTSVSNSGRQLTSHPSCGFVLRSSQNSPGPSTSPLPHSDGPMVVSVVSGGSVVEVEPSVTGGGSSVVVVVVVVPLVPVVVVAGSTVVLPDDVSSPGRSGSRANPGLSLQPLTSHAATTTPAAVPRTAAGYPMARRPHAGRGHARSFARGSAPLNPRRRRR